MAEQSETNEGRIEKLEATPPGMVAVKKVKKKDSWGEVVKTIVYALLIAGVFRSLLFQPFNIPSASMESTLLTGDYLFVSKFSYGFSRASFPFEFIPFSGRIFSAQPERGDVVVFKNRRDNNFDYIKRVIGLPGDRVQVKGGTLYLNGQAVPKVQTEHYLEYFGTRPHEVARYIETLPNGTSYSVLDRFPIGEYDDTEIYSVPEGHYFMMGDNRDNSLDSRADVSFVAHESLVGKAQLIFFSTDQSALLWEVWKWPSAIRYERLFSRVR